MSIPIPIAIAIGDIRAQALNRCWQVHVIQIEIGIGIEIEPPRVQDTGRPGCPLLVCGFNRSTASTAFTHTRPEGLPCAG